MTGAGAVLREEAGQAGEVGPGWATVPGEPGLEGGPAVGLPDPSRGEAAEDQVGQQDQHLAPAQPDLGCFSSAEDGQVATGELGLQLESPA